MWDLKPFSIYTLCSQEKSYVFFQYGIKKHIWFKYFNLEEYDSIFPMWNKKPFEIIF
jgi:hypothetical protein